ncbi:quinohemoprotein amine dehydrogenase subunit beta [Pseudomonas sp. GCM10022188]|uniref:quinohemoprotein amine dehydrogenase subunit beta n=1 Tax=Pseudomonas TaxID=286 RepID=UPI001E58DF0F|nr:quinohemoprotein amine dehydrogenase subunit beta [Pseudomonas oryzagri]MCC6075372.1 quinohemoprotein amine dehydrogenase subunit beta [Pseudomonas oryzagri]
MKLHTIGGLAAAIASLALGLPAHAAGEAGPALKAGHEYLIATNYPNNLHVVDLASDKVYKTCTMPDAYGPGTTQIAPDRKTVYVLNNHYGDLYGIDLDSCNTVFHARLAQSATEKARAIFSIAVSPDGKELYSVANPTELKTDHYVVKAPRLQVYATDAGLDAKPVRSFEVPRQISIMQAGDDGSLYMAGADVYKLDVQTGKYDVALASRNWQRAQYSPPDVLYAWPQQTHLRDFSMLYTAAKFKDDKQDLASADFVYGYFSIDLKTGKTTVQDFAPLTEIYFTGMRSPKDPNQMFGVLNRLAKYDIKEQKLLKTAKLDHSYYCIAFNKAGSKVYLGGTYNELAVFEADSLAPLGKIELPGGDMAIATTQVFTR